MPTSYCLLRSGVSIYPAFAMCMAPTAGDLALLRCFSPVPCPAIFFIVVPDIHPEL
jgi:hypothetical protein